MKKQGVMKVSVKMIPVLTAMMLSMLLIVLPVQAAPDDNAAGYEAIFDSAYYAEHNADLQAAFGNDSNALLNHFIMYGMAEGRQGNEEFNVQYYKNSYPDLQAAFGENLAEYYNHYMNFGKAEGRVGNGEVPDNTSGGNNSSGGTPVTETSVPESVPEKTDEAGGSGFVYEVIELVNQVRAANGLGSVSATPQLMDAAQIRATETATLFSHTRPDGSSCFTAFRASGASYSYAGENIAAGQRTPQSVMDSWMNSPGHRANILNANFKHIGVGCYQISSGYGIYWTQCFTD